MNLGRKIASVFAVGLLIMGLWMLGYDFWFIIHYGFDYNDVAGVCDEGPIDWPTGERPIWANLPLFVYSFPFLASAFAIIFFRPHPPYRGWIRSGCE
jgi:hypothetical protein